MSELGILRDIDNSELELMRSWRNAPNVRANMYTRHEISHEEHQSWWKRAQERTDQKYFIYENSLKSSGVVSFTMIDHVNSNCAWAFYAAPDAAKGTGSKMEFLALEYVFNVLKLNKIYCEVLDFNTPVINLHKKFGFKEEGVFRAQHKTETGYSDIYRLGMLSLEWNENREAMLARINR